MDILIGVGVVLLVLDALRVRSRIASWHRIPEIGMPSEVSVRALTLHEGALLPEHRQRVQRWLEVEQVDAVDLIPSNLDTLEVYGLGVLLDPDANRTRPFHRGQSAGKALVMREELGQRAGIPGGQASNSALIARATHQAKRHAPQRTENAVLSGWNAPPEVLSWRAQVLRESLGTGGGFVMVGSLVIPLLIASFLLWPEGYWVVLAYHLQLPIALFNQEGLQVRGLGLATVFRIPLEWSRAARAQWLQERPVDRRGEQMDALRDAYKERIDRDPAEWFLPRRMRCPHCDSPHLKRRLETPDIYQGKPGVFRLESCEDCGHLFQNPQLSPEGLSFYYSDFYDGLGEELLESIFDAAGNPYDARLQSVLHHRENPPTTWLDVGGGHGHFCLAIRTHSPEVQVDVLDLGDAIHGAVRRGWVDGAIQGFFPEQSHHLEEQYDVVSMSHYLEHTPAPSEEITAAGRVLRSGGLLMIEVPDPESRWGRILGRYWLPFFQPQHLHLYSAKNLQELLERKGFQVLEVERESVHQPVDLSSALILWMQHRFPDRRLPWLENGSRRYERLRTTLWIPAMGLAALLKGVDLVLQPLTRRIGWSNTYRLVAEKRETLVLPTLTE